MTSPEYAEFEEEFEECSCEGGCEECAPHGFDPALAALSLRLMVAAIGEDIDAVGIALDEMGECPHCERAVLIGVLKTVSRYGGEGLAEALRIELLEVLDMIAEDQAEAESED